MAGWFLPWAVGALESQDEDMDLGTVAGRQLDFSFPLSFLFLDKRRYWNWIPLYVGEKMDSLDADAVSAPYKQGNDPGKSDWAVLCPSFLT